VAAVQVHRARSADAFAAGSAEGQRRVDLVLDLDQRVEDHRPAVIEIDLEGVVTRVLAALRVPAVNAEMAHAGGALRLVDFALAVDPAVLGEEKFGHRMSLAAGPL